MIEDREHGCPVDSESSGQVDYRCPGLVEPCELVYLVRLQAMLDLSRGSNFDSCSPFWDNFEEGADAFSLVGEFRVTSGNLHSRCRFDNVPVRSTAISVIQSLRLLRKSLRLAAPTPGADSHSAGSATSLPRMPTIPPNAARCTAPSSVDETSGSGCWLATAAHAAFAR